MTRINIAVLLVSALIGRAHASPLALGHFNAFKSETRKMIAAPHGGFDLNTDHLSLRLIRKLGWSGVVATGFRKDSHPINVNRPTEGVRLKSWQERHTEDARIVFDAFMNHVAEAAPSGLDFYVEIHGMSRPDISDHIQIATVGVSIDQAQAIKDFFEQALRGLGLNYQTKIEGVDRLHYTAIATKSFGSLKSLKPALHIELPWQLRVQKMDKGVELLAKVLPEAAALLIDCERRLNQPGER